MMPISNGKYVAPNWANDSTPALNASELNAITTTAENIMGIEIFVLFADAGTTVTATDGTTVVTLTESSGIWKGQLDAYGTWTINATSSGLPTSANLEVNELRQYTVFLVPGDIDQTNWDTISKVAQTGYAASVWSIGDTKAVLINGTVGKTALNTTVYVYIIGFNHGGNAGITFLGFKTQKTNGVDFCFNDTNYTGATTNGTKWFNMSHWGRSNAGGWKGCDMRYDILGSTNQAPSGYGAAPTSSRIGYDATETTATFPVSNTLMSALPSDLRTVMQPMTIYTDNVGGSASAQANVTASVDYLPLLAEFEVFGAINRANQYEQSYQTQYLYYANGNSKIKYMYSSNSSAAVWWQRSPVNNNIAYCRVNTDGSVGAAYADYSWGVAAMFLV